MRRVSSAATSATDPSVSRARSDRSPRFPIGVPTRYRTPPTRRWSHVRLRLPWVGWPRRTRTTPERRSRRSSGSARGRSSSSPARPRTSTPCSVRCRSASSACGAPASSMDVVVLFSTQERALRARFATLAAGLEPAGRLWIGVAEEGREAPDRSRLRHRPTDRPRGRARRQQERLDHGDVPGSAVRLPREGPAPLRTDAATPLGTPAPVAHRADAPLLQRLNRPWVAILAVTAIAAVVRLWGLSCPPTMVFDENYYAKAACIFVGGSDQVCKVESPNERLFREQEWDVGSFVHPPRREVDDRARHQGVRDGPVRVADRLGDRGHARRDGARHDRAAPVRPRALDVRRRAPARPREPQRRPVAAGAAGHPRPALDRGGLPLPGPGSPVDRRADTARTSGGWCLASPPPCGVPGDTRRGSRSAPPSP